MLRRVQSVAVKEETPVEDLPPLSVERPTAQIERRKGVERRSLDSLRAEAQRAAVVIEEGNPQVPRPVNSSKLPRIALLAVALAAGGLAAFLAVQREPAAPPVAAAVVAEPVTQVVEEPRVKILVAKQAIGIGQRLTDAVIGWEEWPEAALRPEYITAEAAPDALETMGESIARFEFFPGEPIREQKLVKAGEGGYLSALLSSGKRGVSVSVSAESASGGFISPNDRVDVVLTRATGATQTSETILSNVRVLAINSQLGETAANANSEDQSPTAPEAFAHAIATLELDSVEAEVVTSATSLGRLSLVLRSMADFAEANAAPQTVNQAIRMSSPFWAN